MQQIQLLLRRPAFVAVGNDDYLYNVNGADFLMLAADFGFGLEE